MASTPGQGTEVPWADAGADAQSTPAAELPAGAGDRRRSALWSAIALAVAVACLVWFGGGSLGLLRATWDDNFITYIYARNLAKGHGLRYNAVDAAPTEGFSSLSHVLLVAAGYRLNLDPLVTSRALSFLAFALIPLAIGLPVARLIAVPRVPVLAVAYAGQVALLLLEATYCHLELGMETFLFMGAAALLAGWSLAELTPRGRQDPGGAGRAAVGIVGAAFATLTRPEGPILVVLTLGLVWLGNRFLLRRSGPPGTGGSFQLVAVAAGLTIAGYLCWKWLYFGYLLPNPYYVKGHNAIFGRPGVLLPGWRFTTAFLLDLLPALGVCAALFFAAPVVADARRRLVVAALPGLCLVVLYARVIHEAAFYDRYEYPFLVHLQLLFVGLLALHAARFRLLPPLLVAAAVAAVWLFPVRRGQPRPAPGSWLTEGVGRLNHTYVAMGQDLGNTGLGQQATIVLSAAGIVPYYSRFRAVDILGLNDNFLSGRTPRSIEAVWDYIDAMKPDVYFSGLPPATPGVRLEEYDPVLQARPIQDELRGAGGSELTKFWDPEKRMAMIRREMIYLRDHFTFGAAYRYSGGWIILWVREDSPHRDRLLQVLRASLRDDDSSDLRSDFVTDPRRL